MNRGDYTRNGRIIVLLGFDGSGRSSVLQKLHEEGYRVATWKYLQDISELEFMQLSSKSPGKWRENLAPLTRSAYLMLALFAEYEFLIKPWLQKNESVIVDSYYLRPVAKEIAKGKSSMEVLDLVHLLPPPAAVIVFDVPPEICFYRKRIPSINEVLHEQTLSDYCAFQKTVLDIATEMVDKSIIYHIDANSSEESVYRQVKELLEGLK